jgi:nicotinamide-nucleotide amidase
MDHLTLLNLADDLGKSLKQKGWSLALAESCTGGMASQYATAIQGSSSWFDAGFVTYSNHAKIHTLSVNPDTLTAHGAVSEQTAREMATGALAKSQANISGAITGIAGPDGGTPEKPVGTVCFAWAAANGFLFSDTLHFSGNREAIRIASVHTMLERLASLTLTLDL